MSSSPRTIAALLHAGKELSPREVEVLQGMAEGETAGETGARLYLAEDTVKAHRKNLAGKLEARNGVNAVAIAMRRGLIT